MKARKKRGAKSRVGYRKVGTKRSDMRIIDQHGNQWASNYERLVYEGGVKAGIEVRRTAPRGQGDSFAYTHYERGAICEGCGSTKVGKRRSYTPDLFVSTREVGEGAPGYYVEAKGFMRAHQRSLLRSFVKGRPEVNLRFICQSNFRVTKKLNFGQWLSKFCPGIKWAIWTGSWPDDSAWTGG